MTGRGNTVACWSTIAVALTDRRGSEAMTIKRHVVRHDRVTCRVLMQSLCLLGGILLRARRSWRVMGKEVGNVHLMRKVLG